MSTAAEKLTKLTTFCPFCGSDDATIQLDLGDINSLTCSECSETFTAEDAVAKMTEGLKQWEKVVRFVEMGRQLAAE
jgi:transposase-like protein